MIHDFAKLPRTYETARPVKPAPRIRVSRRHIIAVLLLVAAALLVWKKQSDAPVVEDDIQPGQKAATEYQAAMEQEQIEPEPVPEKTVTAKVEPVPGKQAMVAHQTTGKHQPKVSQSKEPRFGFYESLSKSAWSVPVQRGVYVTEEDRKRQANQRYLLQAASLKDAQDARRLVQRLREAGLAATYTSDSSNSWYRVNVGPFDNVSRMNKAEDILVSMRMMPLKRKLP